MAGSPVWSPHANVSTMHMLNDVIPHLSYFNGSEVFEYRFKDFTSEALYLGFNVHSMNMKRVCEIGIYDVVVTRDELINEYIIKVYKKRVIIKSKQFNEKYETDTSFKCHNTIHRARQRRLKIINEKLLIK